MVHTKFCDLRTCNKVKGAEPTIAPDNKKVRAYSDNYLAPSNVGARKGIFLSLIHI